MGRVFLIEKDGSVYTCTTCNVQMAKSEDLLDEWLNIYQFYLVYNVVIADQPVFYDDDHFYGHEVSCVNCCAFLGWRNTAPYQAPGDESMPSFEFEQGRINAPPLAPDTPPQD